MRSEVAQIDKRVRVRTDYRKTNLRAQQGTIAKRWGNPAFKCVEGFSQKFGGQIAKAFSLHLMLEWFAVERARTRLRKAGWKGDN
jgi:hypothetical protein